MGGKETRRTNYHAKSERLNKQTNTRYFLRPKLIDAKLRLDTDVSTQ
jgi:hypothetical protein